MTYQSKLEIHLELYVLKVLFALDAIEFKAPDSKLQHEYFSRAEDDSVMYFDLDLPANISSFVLP